MESYAILKAGDNCLWVNNQTTVRSAISCNYCIIIPFYCFYVINNIGLKLMSLRDFAFLSKIGEGAYSSVHKVRRISDNQLYALKQVTIPRIRWRWPIWMKNKNWMRLTRCVFWRQSTPITSLSTKKPSSILRRTLYASLWNMPTGVICKYLM
jgi:hypothetical protein